MRFGRCDMRCDWCCAIEPLQPKQMPTIVDDGNTDRPMIRQRFSFCCSGDTPAVIKGQIWFLLHVLEISAQSRTLAG